MAGIVSRRRFVVAASAAPAAFALQRWSALAQSTQAPAGRQRPPQLDQEMVHEFVLVAHTDLEKTQKLLEQEPTLARAAWDWGGGDFETGLGGAAHMGRKPIVRFLLSHGARLDLFAAAVLGRLAIVRAVVSDFPDAIDVPGPHGIPLIAHARAGGKEAEPVVSFLQSFAERRSKNTEAVQSASIVDYSTYTGRYRAVHEDKENLYSVVATGASLILRPDGREEKRLANVDGHHFAIPENAVNIEFEVEGGKAKAFIAVQGSIRIRAERID